MRRIFLLLVASQECFVNFLRSSNSDGDSSTAVKPKMATFKCESDNPTILMGIFHFSFSCCSKTQTVSLWKWKYPRGVCHCRCRKPPGLRLCFLNSAEIEDKKQTCSHTTAVFGPLFTCLTRWAIAAPHIRFKHSCISLNVHLKLALQVSQGYWFVISLLIWNFVFVVKFVLALSFYVSTLPE